MWRRLLLHPGFGSPAESIIGSENASGEEAPDMVRADGGRPARPDVDRLRRSARALVDSAAATLGWSVADIYKLVETTPECDRR